MNKILTGRVNKIDYGIVTFANKGRGIYFANRTVKPYHRDLPIDERVNDPEILNKLCEGDEIIFRIWTFRNRRVCQVIKMKETSRKSNNVTFKLKRYFRSK